MKLKAQPIKMQSMYELWTQEPVVAAEAWVKGPIKPREALRIKEVPPEDVSLETLQKKGMIEVCEPLKVESPEDLEKVPEDVDFIIIGKTEDFFVQDAILEKLISLGKPILAEWDNWGYAWFGRWSKLRFGKFSKSKYYYPMGSDDLKPVLSAFKAWKFIRTMRVVYVGDLPPRAVTTSDKISDFNYLKKRFGTDFIHLNFDDYIKAIQNTSDSDVEALVKEWKSKYDILDERDKKLKFYAKIYSGLKKLLNQHNADVVTIDCSWLPDVEYVPCFAFSLLLDEGVPAVCEGDIPALYTMAAIMSACGKPVLMGNLISNATHRDLENNFITINHDVIPPSMGCSRCRLKLRDFHATGKGLTPYVDLEKDMPVTVSGMHWDMDRIWATKGTIQWSEDTTHCRVTVGIKVENAKEMYKSSSGHHVVMAYGDCTRELEILAELLEMRYISL